MRFSHESLNFTGKHFCRVFGSHHEVKSIVQLSVPVLGAIIIFCGLYYLCMKIYNVYLRHALLWKSILPQLGLVGLLIRLILAHILTISRQPQIRPHIPLFSGPLRAGGLEKRSLSILAALTVHLIPAMREQAASGVVCCNFSPSCLYFSRQEKGFAYEDGLKLQDVL